MTTSRLIVGVALTAAVAADPGADLRSVREEQFPGIAGRVIDRAGRPLGPVGVVVLAEAGSGVWSTLTGPRDGIFSIGVPAGSYRVVFDLSGFDLTRRNHVRVRVGEVMRLDVTLDVATLCECIEWAGTTGDPRAPDLRERSGQVLDEAGLPIPYTSLVVVSATSREQAFTDQEGRFRVRLSARQPWPITAVAAGFAEQTQAVRGDSSAPILFRLGRTVASGGMPEVEVLRRPCRCHSDLFTHRGR